jgi:hypothetical protein
MKKYDGFRVLFPRLDVMPVQRFSVTRSVDKVMGESHAITCLSVTILVAFARLN